MGGEGGWVEERSETGGLKIPFASRGTSSSAEHLIKTVRWTGRAMTKGLTWQKLEGGRNDSNNRAVRQNRSSTGVLDNPNEPL